MLARPIAADTGWPLPLVIGGFSLGVLVSGLVSPRVGSTIDRLGGRAVLAAGSGLLGAGFLVLALAHHPAAYLLAWAVIGAGMGAALYDPAFATLGRLYGERARRPITALTLWGGFASTVGWPLTALLADAFGWRGACLAYAAIHAGLCLPVHLLLVPRTAPAAPRPAAQPPSPGAPRGPRRTMLLLLGAVMILSAVVSSVIALHVIGLLQARGLDLAAAVALGALIGPAQVGARLVEMTLGPRFHPIWTLVTAVGLVLCGLATLALTHWAALALLLYGAGNGLFSIARGTVPLALFGRDGYGALMGRLALPALLAAALAPSLGAVAIESLGAGATLAILAAASAGSMILALVLRARATGGTP